MPAGWSTNTTANYTTGLQDAGGGTSRSGKLQATDHHFTIFFYDEPAQVSYYLKSYGTVNFAGTLLVQESTNGSSWTTLHSFGNNSFNDQWTQFTDVADPDSRYIRFVLSNKVSGTNVGLDNVVINELVPTYQEMNVLFEGNDVPNNTGIQFASPLSTALSIKLVVENNGTVNALSLNSASFSGPASADYTLVSIPSSVGASSVDTLEISFNPSANGSRVATISIANNDQNENPYVINLNGIGGSGASEPTDSPTAFSTQTLKTYRIIGSFTPNAATGYLVLYRINAPVQDQPTDGIVYTKGEGIGTAKVAHAGNESTFEISDARASTVYHIKVFAYNGSGNFINYRTSDPLSDSISSPSASMVDNQYYSGIDISSNTFVTDLHDLINPHFVRFYSNYGPDMVAPFLSRDTADGQKVMTGVYSGFNIVYTPPFDWTSTNMNREHTFPASWMPSAGDNSTPEYQDLHHLMPTVATANSQRSNHPLGKVITASNSYGQGKVGTDAYGNTVYEPRDAQKGDAARAIFYMQTAYNGSSSWAIADLGTEGPMQRVDVLVNWHLTDLPSGFEKARNDFVDSLQNNRNPYVDSAQWVCYVNFATVTYNPNPDSTCLALTGVEAPSDSTDTISGMGFIPERDEWIFYPNPTSNYFFAEHRQGSDFEMTVYSMLGEKMLYSTISGSNSIDLNELVEGIYIVQLSAGDDRKSIRLVKTDSVF